MIKWNEHIEKIKNELDMVDYGSMTDRMYERICHLVHLMKEYQKFDKKENGEECKEDVVFKVKFEGKSNIEDLEDTMHDIYDTFCKIDISTKGNDTDRTFIKQKIKEIYSMFNGD